MITNACPRVRMLDGAEAGGHDDRADDPAERHAYHHGL